MIKAKPEVENLSAYSAPLEGRRGMLRLDFNENTVGPSPRVLEAIRALGPDAYATYPEYAGLEARFARELSLPDANVSAFNGVDAAIRAVFDAFGDAGTHFLTTAPTFGYYAPCAAQQGMRPVNVPYGENLSFPLEAFRQRLADGPRMAFICNPNNPTGTLLPAAQVLELARSAKDTLVVVDELYADFTGVTVLPESLSLDNLLVLRSLSKSRGLAALRLGFAIGPADILDRMQRVTGPYDINSFAVTAAHASLDDRNHMIGAVAEIKRAKAWTVAALRERGVRFHADGGNYILVWPPETPNSGADPLGHAVTQLKADGILVRSMAGKLLIDGSFRLTIGTCEQMQRFMGAFDKLLS